MASVMIARPDATEYAPFYSGYVNAVPEGDLIALLERQGDETLRLLGGITETKSQERYAPGKWTIREVAGHMIDAERVFTYRALTFARADPGPLPSFDENAWAGSSNAGSRTMRELGQEFSVLRASTLSLFRGFTEESFARSGIASKHAITVRALAYIVAGHERHHVKILRDRYLSS